MSEAAMEQQCRRYVSKLGLISIKLYGGVAGDPDRVVLLPNGRCLLVEFKMPDGRLSPRQVYRHTELEGIGHRVAVVYSTQQFMALLDSILG